jgi:predicted lipoprotein with Yx(FWY)xxD motif
MSLKNSHDVLVLGGSIVLGFAVALQLSACGTSPPGLTGDPGGSGAGGQVAEGGSDPGSTAGSGESGKVGGTGKAGNPGHMDEGGEGGESAAGAPTSEPEGGATAAGGTIEGGGGTSGESAVAGQGGSGEAVIPTACPFHSDAPVGTGGNGGGTGSGGSGGAAGAAATITLQLSPFVGNYLADASGRTLYTYGADLPGDCQTPPVSTCVTDCLLTWPIFPAGARILAPGLDDGAFGAIHRADGTWQTTYFGWPIYYNKSDLLLGQVAGQGKGKTWHIAQQNPAAVVIMKAGAAKYLGDVAGHTLYVSAADLAGTVSTDPESNCSGACLATFEPFHEKNFSVVTSLLISDFSSFVRHGKGGLQVAYKGQPLYRAATDLKSGDMTGVTVSGFTAAVP